MRLEDGQVNVGAVIGECKADADAGVSPATGTPEIVTEIRQSGGPGINAVLEAFLQKK